MNQPPEVLSEASPLMINRAQIWVGLYFEEVSASYSGATDFSSLSTTWLDKHREGVSVEG
jgi:hypothetical protein